VDKVKVKTYINDGDDGLFAAVLDVVDVDVRLANLQAGRYPDAKDADVNGKYNGKGRLF
jgi:hypothetical protein